MHDDAGASVASLSQLELKLEDRVVFTLDLAARWGFAVEVQRLGDMLLGGAVERTELADVLARSARIYSASGFATLLGHESLIEKSVARTRSHSALNGAGRLIAERYSTELVRLCPWVRSVALSGSIATGGFAFGDDLDFDLFVDDDTRYLTYLLGMALGTLISLRHRRLGVSSSLLRKLICINVVWTASESRPFVRQDDAMAFELSLAQPLFGVSEFAEVLRSNPNLTRTFPQMLDRVLSEVPRPTPSRLGRLLWSTIQRPLLRRTIDRLCRAASWFAYHAYSLVLSPEGRERRRFLQRAKYPYEIFQD